MIKRCCAFLSALMIILFSTFSQYAAIPAYAAMDPRYYVAVGPLIASIFTAYGYKRSGTNSALADLVAQCVVDAANAGYTTLRNGVQSCGIAIEDGISYCKKDFLDWVYSWCNDHNMSTPQVDGSLSYPSYVAGQNVSFVPYSGTWQSYASSCGFPSAVISAIENSSYASYFNNKTLFGAKYENYDFVTNYKPNYSNYYLCSLALPAGNYDIVNTSLGGYSYLSVKNDETIGSANTAVRVHYENDEYTVYRGGSTFNIVGGGNITDSEDLYYGSGVTGPYTLTTVFYSSSFNAVYTAGSAGYEVSDDAPSTTKTFTEYVSNPASWEGLNSWGGKEKNVNIDGTNTTGMPITIPIDIIINGQQIGAAVADIVAGAQAAVDAALAMTQQIAREGTITEAAEGELEEANTAVENTMEVADAQPIVNDILGWGIDYVKPHLSNVFKKYPFSIPYDLYLILNSLYSGAVSAQSLRSVRASGQDPTNTNPSDVGVTVDFDYVSKSDIGLSDSSAPKFDYDFYITSFSNSFHFVGSLDFAPFAGLIALMKVGLGLIWLVILLLWNYRDLKGEKKNG